MQFTSNFLLYYLLKLIKLTQKYDQDIRFLKPNANLRIIYSNVAVAYMCNYYFQNLKINKLCNVGVQKRSWVKKIANRK